MTIAGAAPITESGDDAISVSFEFFPPATE